MMRRAALFVWMLLGLGLARPGYSLDPLPVVEKGPGFRTWMVESERPLLRLEDALAGLRSTDRMTYEKTLTDLGIQEELQGEALGWPELEQPIEAKTAFLSFERRKLAVISAPFRGRNNWMAVVLRQEGNGEAYWRAIQVFEFDTDPVQGLGQSFPDINGDDIDFWMVTHLNEDDIYGRAEVSSIFKYDEKRLRLVFNEAADQFQGAKFQGTALKLEQKLVFNGDQKIVRQLTLKTYPYMRREEFNDYDGVKAAQAEPAKVQHVQETFAWDPVDFDFYQDVQELEKLVTSKSPFIRREAARRLGEHMKTTHPQLEKAMLSDKSAYVRIQCALALGSIGDPKALPSVEKALLNYHEPDNVREALEQTEAKLKAVLAARPTPVATPTSKKKKRKKKKEKKPEAAAALSPVTGPKISGNN